MKFDLGQGELNLRANQPISLREARGIRLICTEGMLWVTLNGVGCDIFLRAGDSYRIGSDGLVLAESLGSGRLRLALPARHSVWRRLRDRFHPLKKAAAPLPV